MNILDTIFKDFQTIMRTVVIKYDNLARKYETADTKRAGDAYVLAMDSMDTFRSYSSFPLDIIIASGLAKNETEAKPYIEDKYKIPASHRDQIVKLQRQNIIDNFVEYNNYYRMLSGLPDNEDIIPILINEEVADELGIDPDKPIHEMTSDDIARLDKQGELAVIQAKYPTKKYLLYLGDNKIPIYKARTSGNFAILRMNSDVGDSFYEEFDSSYALCREYFLSVVYNKGYGGNYDLYDNFIGMCIMVFTIQRLVSNAFKNGIDFNFYDLGTIQKLFAAYNVPFIENLPLTYQQILVRNLNNLLRYKSTDKVLYDICALLGFERIEIFKYFLVKQHRLDVNGNPIFPKKEARDDLGEVTMVDDKEKMYNLFFQSVELRERNQSLALSDTKNIMDYDQVIVDDPYWSNDQELMEYLYERDFNYIETKFLSLNVMYKMTEMLFEVSYIFRLLHDKKEELVGVTIELPKIFQNEAVDLFNIVCLLCALISKKSGMAGNILSTPSKILAVNGFNFNQNMDTIRQIIRDNKHIIDQDILKYLDNMRIMSPEDVNRLYAQVRNFNDYLVDKLSTVQDLDQYRIYQQIFDALLITEENAEIFKKTDGSIATTYIDYLEDREPLLGTFVSSADPNLIGEYIEHILSRLNDKIKELKYLFLVNDSNNVLFNAMVTLIRFFKSYTTDLTSFNILYVMDGRYQNMVKVISHIQTMESNMSLDDLGLMQHYNSSLQYTVNLLQKEKQILKDSVDISSKFKVKDKQTMRDTIRMIR